MAKLTVNLPNRPEGDPIQIPGLGVFPNGAVYAVSALEEDTVFGTEKPKKSKVVKYVPPPVFGVIDARDPETVEQRGLFDDLEDAPVKDEDMGAEVSDIHEGDE